LSCKIFAISLSFAPSEIVNSISAYCFSSKTDSEYEISTFLTTQLNASGVIDLTSDAAMAASGLKVTGTLTLTSGAQNIDYIALSIPPNMVLTTNNALNWDFYRIEAGNEVWITAMPALTTGNTCNVDVTLKPFNPHLWSCDNVSVSMYSFIEIPFECEMHTCNLGVRHDNEEISENIPVRKTDVSFVAGSIVATGVYNTATTEAVTLVGKLKVPENTDLANLKIEPFTNVGGTLQPILGATPLVLPLVKTLPGVLEFPFSTVSPLIIPAADMCNLYLVIRRSIDNPYICDDVAVQIPSPGFSLTDTEVKRLCPGIDIPVGDANPIAGYTYTWTPTANIVGNTTGTPIIVRYPASAAGNQTLTLTVNRGGCTVQTTTVISMNPGLAAPFAKSPQTFCTGAKVLNLQADGVVVVWFDSHKNLLDENDVITAGIYYCAQTNAEGCPGDRTSIRVIIDDEYVFTPPDLPEEIELCAPAYLSDIPTDGNTNLVWYDENFDPIPDPTTHEIFNDEIYYVENSGGGDCVSEQIQITIKISVFDPDIPIMETPQQLCDDAMVVNLAKPNNQILWYIDETTPTALDPSEKLRTGLYWAVQKAGSCFSARTPVEVSLLGFSAPKVQAEVNLCAQNVTYIADIPVTGIGIRWFDAHDVEILTPETTLLEIGKTYKAVQSSGDCLGEPAYVFCSDLCYEVSGTVFPFAYTGEAAFDALFVTTAKLYPVPPATIIDKVGWVRKQNPLKKIEVKYYDCIGNPIIGAPKNPGVMGAANNPGLKILWNNPGIIDPTLLTIGDHCPNTHIGVFEIERVAPGDYILEIARAGFLPRYSKVKIENSHYMGHREILGGDINGDLVINEKDLSAILSKSSAYGNAAYDWKCDLDGNGQVGSTERNIIRINLNTSSEIYEETTDWIK
jgi:hypothetical protein